MTKNSEKNVTDNVIDDSFQPPKKKSKFVKKLFRNLIIIIVLILGFLYLQQSFLDLEAIAIVRAACTATSAAALQEAVTKQPAPLELSPTPSPIQATLTTTETPGPNLARTATIAAQLTSVAEFQQTATNSP